MCSHGFTASPEEMRWLGEYLHERGLTVYAPRLAGHGTDPDMMRRQHRLDWYESVLDGIALLRARCRKVFAVGLSMGGLLSFQAAAAGLVDGAVIMAAPLRLRDPRLKYARFLKYIRPYVPKEDWPGTLGEYVKTTQRSLGRDDYGRMDYDTVPTASVQQLVTLMTDVRDRLCDVTVPLLLIYSKGDQTVPYDNLAIAATHVRSKDVVVRSLERSDHCLTQEIERETVYAMVWDFLSARLD